MNKTGLAGEPLFMPYAPFESIDDDDDDEIVGPFINMHVSP